MTDWPALLSTDAPDDHARLARTMVAASSYLAWDDERHHLRIPFVEEAGSPLLLVDRQLGAELMQVGVGHVELMLDGPVRSVRLSGTFWAVANGHADPIVADVRRAHALCADCPGRTASRLVGLQVDQVELSRTVLRYQPVDLDAYERARPDPLLATGLRLTDHLNAEHAAELLHTAADLTLVPEGTLAAARVEWIDATGLELLVVDGDGGHRVHATFAHAADSPDRLVDAVHHWLLARPSRHG